ncbi:DNA-binding protein [Leptolyngbya sp. ST-U4]|uniref:DNA-binding protein n=1 Tax=Leptolyngbya sp. ST-U4 TaxID=2933912 RepID=UPI0032980921
MNLSTHSEHKINPEGTEASEHSQEIIEEYGHRLDAIAFRRSLIAWGKENFRAFPWRFTHDPYHILIAEVMLHRTQARQVLPVYKQFVARYPNLESLANASERELREILYSLGLHWRIELLHKMVRELATRFEGRIPADRENLLALPGVSDYIASAFRCFALNQSDALIDTNTVRIVARLFGLPVKDSLRRNKRFMSLIGAMVDPEEPKFYNYALLDLANKICLKSNPPICRSCPIQTHCLHGGHSLTHERSYESSFEMA